MSERAADPIVEPLPSGHAIEYARTSADYRIHELSGSRVGASLSLGEAHHEPYGIVHGGIHAIAVEGLATTAPARPAPTEACTRSA
jgi:acyl-coenzyme A thioesterase PaaI-like protein